MVLYKQQDQQLVRMLVKLDQLMLLGLRMLNLLLLDLVLLLDMLLLGMDMDLLLVLVVLGKQHMLVLDQWLNQRHQLLWHI